MEEFHELLAEVDERTATQRVLAAIAYKQGDSKTRLAERHDVTWKTVHSWLNRFAEQPIEQAPYDEHRSGRPSKLSEEQREVLFDDLHRSPEEFGYDPKAWFPTLLAHHVKETFDGERSPCGSGPATFTSTWKSSPATA
jgi:transposase